MNGRLAVVMHTKSETISLGSFEPTELGAIYDIILVLIKNFPNTSR